MLRQRVLTAIVLVYLIRSPRRRLAVALAVVPLALFVNILRVAALVMLSMRYGIGILDTWVHSGTGVAARGSEPISTLTSPLPAKCASSSRMRAR